MWRNRIKENKKTAAAIVVLLVLALVSALAAYEFHTRVQAAKQAEDVAKKRIESMEKEAEAKTEAFRAAIGATEPALKDALQGVRKAKESLIQVEAVRRELWVPPAVDNGDLVVRFERALEALR